MKLLIQKDIGLISGFIDDDESFQKSMFDIYDFDPTKKNNEQLAEEIVKSEGTSYLLNDINSTFNNAIFYSFKNGVLTKEQDNLEVIRAEKIHDLYSYHASNDIKSVTINGNVVWIDSEKRDALLRRLSSEKNTKTNALSSIGILNVDRVKALEAIKDLEIYSSACWDVTYTIHKVAIYKLATVKDINSYNIKTRYPKKLEIKL